MNTQTPQQSFSQYEAEIIKALDGVRMSEEFKDKMLMYFVDGYTADEALSDFCRNSNEELEKDILEITN